MQHIQLLSTLWLSGFFMYPSDHYFLWKHLKRRRREGRKRTHRGRMGRRESNRALFSFKNLGMVSNWSIIFTILITTLKSYTQRRLQQSKYLCDQVNDFPVVNGTPGIIQDPIDLLLTKYNFTNKRSWASIAFQYLQYSWPFISKIAL